MKNKHVFNFKDFLVEQDLMGGMGAPAPAAAPKVIEYDFLFMTGPDDAGNARKKYLDGSVDIEYPCYSMKLEDLENWAKDNITTTDSNKLNSSEIDIRRKSLIDIVKGDRTNISNDDLPFIEKLKNSAAINSSNIIVKPDVTVSFLNGKPSTTDIDVTFIKHKK